MEIVYQCFKDTMLKKKTGYNMMFFPAKRMLKLETHSGSSWY